MSAPLNLDPCAPDPAELAEYTRIALDDALQDCRAELARRSKLLACYREELQEVRVELQRWSDEAARGQRPARTLIGSMRALATSIAVLLDQAGQGPGGDA